MMNTRLATFIQVAQLKSYTKAAEHLHLTQPAVTQHIQQLEEYYQVKLFHKNGRQIFLTEEGELLLKSALDFEADALLLERALKNKSSVVKRYHIGATLTIGEFVLPTLLGAYKRTHQNTDVIMHVHNLEEVLNKVSRGELDLGMVEGPFDRRKFAFRKMKEDELVLVASPQSEMFMKNRVEMDDVLAGNLILREKGSGTRIVFENKLTELGYNLPDLKIYMEVGSIGAIKSLVEANLGYTVISKEAVLREAASGTLAIIPIHGVQIQRELNFVFLEHQRSGFVEEFMEFITGENAV
jgi:DNA-binding transcriptional LysR family regulator